MTNFKPGENKKLDTIVINVLNKRTIKCGDKNYFHLIGHLMGDQTLKAFTVVDIQGAFRRLHGESKIKLNWNGSKAKLF